MAITKLSCILTAAAQQFVVLNDDLKTAMSKVVVTPNGYIEMPQELQQKFVADVGGLSQSSMQTSTDFNSIIAELKAIRNAVDAANPDNGKNEKQLLEQNKIFNFSIDSCIKWYVL